MEPAIMLVLTCAQAKELVGTVQAAETLTYQQKVQIVRKIASWCQPPLDPWFVPDTTRGELSQRRYYGPSQTHPLPLWDLGKYEKSCRTEIQTSQDQPGQFSEIRKTDCTLIRATF